MIEHFICVFLMKRVILFIYCCMQTSSLPSGTFPALLLKGLTLGGRHKRFSFSTWGRMCWQGPQLHDPLPPSIPLCSTVTQTTCTLIQGSQVTKYIYSHTVLEYNFEVLSFATLYFCSTSIQR